MKLCMGVIGVAKVPESTDTYEQVCAREITIREAFLVYRLIAPFD